jgi:4-hydroxybenzoate polyprenyltransferase
MVLKRIKAYGGLVMFAHTLFSIPFGIIAMLMAADGFPSLWLTAWIFVALISARTAANALNRLVDKDIDAKNPRTASRHMPQGVVKTGEAVILVAICLVILIISAFMISPICVGLLPIPLFLFFIYSFTKRFTWWCHIILGAACACAPLGAWVAVTGEISATPVVLGAAVMLWVAGFDIIYGAQDVEFDRENDLHSIPAAFGVRNALIISAVFHLLAVALLVYVGILVGLGLIYYIGVGMITALLVYEHAIVSPTNLKNVTIASYSINQIVSTIFLLLSGADILIKSF